MIRKSLWQIEHPWRMLGLVSLFVISSWQLYQLLHSEAQNKQLKSHQPDSIGYSLTLERFDTSGFLTSVSTADKATHYPDTQTTEFENVRSQLLNHNAEVSPWLVTAPTGKAYNKGKKFELNGNVVMSQAAYPNHPATTITTSEVAIFPDDKLVVTDQPIAMQQPGVILNGVGARYNYETQILNLLHQVVVHYQPDKKN